MALLLMGCGGKSFNKVPALQGEMEINPRILLRGGPAVLSVRVQGPEDPLLWCPTVVWDFGDGTKREHQASCDPYDPLTSRIPRRYSTTHGFRWRGNFRPTLKLMVGDKVVYMVTGSIQVGQYDSIVENP